MSDNTVKPTDAAMTAETRPEERPLAGPGDAATPATSLVESELLVEDVSIDGMCGVY